MPELATAWVTLAANTRGMERDIARSFRRVEQSTRLDPRVDTSRLGAEGDRAGRSFSQRFNSAASNAGKSAGMSVGKAFSGAFAGFLSAQALASVAQTAARAVADEFKSVFETGLSFEKTLNNFQGVTRATAGEMRQMQQAARALGGDTTLAGASSSDAATAMTELAKAGFSVDQAMTAARGTLELATAGQIEAAQAAEIQSNAINAFGLSATDAAHVADLLANAAVSSSADIPDIGQALQQVGGIAKGFGENLDDTIATLAMFANAGVKGSDAGTLLKTTMQSITDQGNPAQGAIHELGLELYKLDANGGKQFVGFRELFRQLDEAKRRMNDPEWFQAQTNILFGSDAMRSAMLGSAEGFDKMLSDIERVGGASELAGAQMQGLPGAVESFSNTVESIRLDAFDALGPALAGPLGEFVTYLSDHKADVVAFFVNVGGAAITMAEAIIANVGLAAGVLANLADVFGMDDTAQSLRFVADASDEAFGALEEGKRNLDAYGRRAEEAAKFTTALGTSVKTLKLIGDEVTIDVKDNTPEVRDNLTKMGAHLEQLADDPTRLKIVSDTAEADHGINAWRQQQTGTPVDVSFAVHFDAGKSFLPDWMKYLGGTLGPAPLPVSIAGAQLPTQITAPGPPAGGGSPIPGLGTLLLPSAKPRAAGGVFGALPTDALIQPATAGLIQWAEPSTGGEAFIPLSGGQRSAQIWAKTGHLLGMFDQGGIRGSKGGLKPNASQLFDIISQAFPQIQTIGGYRANGMGSNDHPSGQALDIMIPNWDTAEGKALGDQINQWLQSNASSLGVDATIWQDFWKPAGGEGHLLGRMGQGPDQAHLTHIHAKTNAGAATGASFSAVAGAGEYGAADPKKVREAEQRVVDADAKVVIQEQQLAELKADASKSQRLQQEEDVRKAKQDAADARADLAEAKKGTLKESKSGAGGSGGSEGESLGQGIISGLLQGLGLDGSVFSNPLEWPNVKSGMAALNWGGGLLKSAMGGDQGGTGGADLGFAGGMTSGLGLPGLADFIKPIGPQALDPNIDPSSLATGPAPGPTFNVTATGDPKRIVETQHAAFNNAYRGSGLPAVRPS